MYERFGRGDDVPEAPELAACYEYLLTWFSMLSARRQPSMGGVAPLTYRDIQAWRDLTGTIILPEEVVAIMSIDDHYRKEMSSQGDSNDGRSQTFVSN